MRAHLLLSLLVLIAVSCSSAFLPAAAKSAATVAPSSVILNQANKDGDDDENNFFSQIGKFFNSLNNNDDNEGGQLDEDEDDDGGTDFITNLVTLKVKSLKPGGLRLFFMLFLMGVQNTPSPKTWTVVQADNEDDQYAIDLYYTDQSALLQLKFDADKNVLIIQRFGTSPTTPYLLQESLVVDGILEELETMAKDDAVEPNDRLLQLLQENDVAQFRKDVVAFQ